MEKSRLLSRGGAHAAHIVYMAGYVTPWIWWQSHHIWCQLQSKWNIHNLLPLRSLRAPGQQRDNLHPNWQPGVLAAWKVPFPELQIPTATWVRIGWPCSPQGSVSGYNRRRRHPRSSPECQSSSRTHWPMTTAKDCVRKNWQKTEHVFLPD